VSSFVSKTLNLSNNFDILTTTLSTEQWLVTPQQLLLSLTAGRVFHQSLMQLSIARAKLLYLPDNVRRFGLIGVYRDISVS
jgi:hypothetical protein